MIPTQFDNFASKDGSSQKLPVIKNMGPNKIAAGRAADAADDAEARTEAQLPFGEKRLTRAEKRHLSRYLRPQRCDSPLTILAKLFISVSLITGRELKQIPQLLKFCSLTEFESTINELGIDVSQGLLMMRVKGFNPKNTKNNFLNSLKNLPTCSLSIPLPRNVACLARINQEGTICNEFSDSLAHAEYLIRRMPKMLAITPKRISSQLSIALISLLNGDLALPAMLANKRLANSQNLLHYASYFDEFSENVWSTALVKIRILSRHQVETNDRKEGTQPSFGAAHRIPVPHVRNIVNRNIENFHAAVSDDLSSALNAFVMHYMLWTQFIGVSRSFKSAGPVCVIDDVGIGCSIDKGDSARLCAISESWRTGIQHYLAVMHSMAATDPRLSPITRDRSGLWRLRFPFFAGGIVVEYDVDKIPQHMKILLPTNWARKLIRTELVSRMGRGVDILLGHETIGRAPYGPHSTFAAKAFFDRWSGALSDLETKCSFAPLKFPGFEASAIPLSSFQQLIDEALVEKKPDVLTIDEVLSSFKEDEKYDQLDTSSEIEVSDCVDMIYRYLLRHPEDTRAERMKRTERAIQLVEKRWAIFLRVESRQTPVSLLDPIQMTNLTVIESIITPHVKKDLAHLPRPDNNSLASEAEIGRLLHYIICYQRITSWEALIAFIDSYCRKPILASKELRYLELLVKAGRSQSLHPRLLFLTDFSTTLLVSHRQPYVAKLQEIAYGAGRRARLDRCLTSYYRNLGVTDRVPSIDQLCGAAMHRSLLMSAPVVAAYEAALITFSDISDRQFRRNNNEPPRSGIRSYFAHAAPSIRTVQKHTLAKLDNGEELTITELAKSLALGHLPSGLKILSGHEPMVRMLHDYSKWLARPIPPDDHELSQHTIAAKINIVGSGVVGLLLGLDHSLTICREFLRSGAELSDQYFPDRHVAVAWASFGAYCRGSAKTLRRLGIPVERLGRPNAPSQRAEFFSESDCVTLKQLLSSPLCRSMSESERNAAMRILDLLHGPALRNLETTRLTPAHVHGDLIRLHRMQLKNRSANRLVLKDLVEFLRDGTELPSNKSCNLVTMGDRNVNCHTLLARLLRLTKVTMGDARSTLNGLRHSAASRILLSMLAANRAIDIKSLVEVFPFLTGTRLDIGTLDSIFDGEPDCGQGLMILARMLGHAGPSRTITSYVDVLFVASFGQILQDQNAFTSTDAFDRCPGFTKQAMRQMRRRKYIGLREIRQLAERKFPTAVHIDNSKLQFHSIVRKVREQITIEEAATDWGKAA